MRLYLSVLLAAITLSACQTTSEVPVKVGTTVTEQFSVGNKIVPLPPGEWKVAGSAVRTTLRNNTLSDTILIQVDGGTLAQLITVTGNLSPTAEKFQRKGWEPGKMCLRTNMLYVKVFANERQGRQDCWGINHRRLQFNSANPPAQMEAARRFIVENSILFPLNTVDVFFHFATESDYLEVYYYHNPDLAGIAPSPHPGWSDSDWNRDRIHQHPDKVAYVEKLKAWGASWHDRVARGFDGPH